MTSRMMTRELMTQELMTLRVVCRNKERFTIAKRFTALPEALSE